MSFFKVDIFFWPNSSHWFARLNPVVSFHFFSIPLVHYLRKNLEPQKKAYLLAKWVGLFQSKRFKLWNSKKMSFWPPRITAFFEAGLYADIFGKIDREFTGYIRKYTTIFHTLADFVDEYTDIEPLSQKYFQPLFGYFMLILFLIYLTFVLHHLFNAVARLFSRFRIHFPIFWSRLHVVWRTWFRWSEPSTSLNPNLGIPK